MCKTRTNKRSMNDPESAELCTTIVVCRAGFLASNFGDNDLELIEHNLN